MLYPAMNKQSRLGNILAKNVKQKRASTNVAHIGQIDQIDQIDHLDPSLPLRDVVQDLYIVQIQPRKPVLDRAAVSYTHLTLPTICSV